MNCSLELWGCADLFIHGALLRPRLHSTLKVWLKVILMSVASQTFSQLFDMLSNLFRMPRVARAALRFSHWWLIVVKCGVARRARLACFLTRCSHLERRFQWMPWKVGAVHLPLVFVTFVLFHLVPGTPVWGFPMADSVEQVPDMLPDTSVEMASRLGHGVVRKSNGGTLRLPTGAQLSERCSLALDFCTCTLMGLPGSVTGICGGCHSRLGVNGRAISLIKNLLGAAACLTALQLACARAERASERIESKAFVSDKADGA